MLKLLFLSLVKQKKVLGKTGLASDKLGIIISHFTDEPRPLTQIATAELECRFYASPFPHIIGF